MSAATSQFPIRRSCAHFVARGAYYDCTAPEALDALFEKERVTAYIGFDCTAPSLHVGKPGADHDAAPPATGRPPPIVLMGGGTTKVGDPSGKDETRQLLTHEQIEANKKAILAGFENLSDIRRRAVATRSWSTMPNGSTSSNTFPSCARVGRHFSVNRMLTMDSVKLRLEREQPLSASSNSITAPAGLRFSWSCTAATAAACNPAARINGAISFRGIDLARRMDNARACSASPRR